MAQLAEQSLPTPEISRLSPDISSNLFDFICLSTVSQFREAENQIDKAKADAMFTSRGAIKNNARTTGQLLSNIVASDVALNKNANNAISNLNQTKEQTNKGILNETNRMNTQIANEEHIAREQNKAAYRQAIYGALTDMGNIGSGYIKDNAMLDSQTLQNNRTLSMLNSLPGDYRWVIDANGVPQIIRNK